LVAVKSTVARNELIYADAGAEFEENGCRADRWKEKTPSHALNRRNPFLIPNPIEEVRDAAGNRSSVETASI
jgi:hypothetical protein